MTIETLSEALFKQHCAKRSIICRRIAECGRKVADFELTLSCGLAVVEIKQLDPNESDRAREALPPHELTGAGYAPTGRVRNLLADAYHQIKPYAAAGVPGIVVCYNNAGGLNYIDNFTITRALFGGMAVYLSLGRNGGIHQTEQGFTSKRKITRNTCRGLSAVCVLSTPSRASTQLAVYHNPYASHPLPPSALRTLADAQFGYADPHGVNPQFLAHEI